MHKWAVKQFIRLVPHGRHMTSHLTARHYAQLLFTQPQDEQDKGTNKLLHCHCGQDPCLHDMHVHVSMPGLRDEDEHGMHFPGDTRSVTRWDIDDDTPDDTKRALQGFVGRVNGEDWHLCQPPDAIWKAQTMELSWHNRSGELEVRERLHASADYYDRGAWYDAVVACHTVPRSGGQRRLPQERGRAERVGRVRPADGEDEVVEDVAQITGLFFCQIPHGKHKGEWHPLIMVLWQQYFNAFGRDGMVIDDGDRAGMLRCQALLEELGWRQSDMIHMRVSHIFWR